MVSPLFVSSDHHHLPIGDWIIIRHILVLFLSESTTASTYNRWKTKIGCATLSYLSFLLTHIFCHGHRAVSVTLPSLFLVTYIYCCHIFLFSFSFPNFIILCFIPSHSKTWTFCLIFNSNFRTKPFFFFFLKKSPFYCSSSGFPLCYPTYSQGSFLVLNRPQHWSPPPSPQASSDRAFPTITTSHLYPLTTQSAYQLSLLSFFLLSNPQSRVAACSPSGFWVARRFVDWNGWIRE